MSSKGLVLGSILCAMLVTTAGCTDYLRGSKSKSSDVLDVHIQETECLKSVPTVIAKAFEDLSSDKEIEDSFSCLDRSLKTFAKYTRGQTAELYTERELQYFLNRYLLDANKISDVFMDELMKLKVMAVGGSPGGFTRAEITQVGDYLGLIKTQMLKLNGVLRILLFQQDRSQVSSADIERAAGLLRSSGEALIFESKISNSDYELSDFVGLFRQIQSFSQSERISTSLKWFPLMLTIKDLFLGKHAKIISKAEWKETLAWSSRAYGLALRLFYQSGAIDFKKPNSWNQLIGMTDELMELVERAPLLVQTGMLPTGVIDQMIDQVLEMHLVDFTLSSDVIKNTYKKILFHWFDSRNGEAFEVVGFENRHMSLIKFEYEVWKQGQKMLNAAFEQKNKFSSEELVSFAENRRDHFASSTSKLKKAQLDLAWASWMETFHRERVPVLQEDLKLILTFDPKIAKHNFYGSTVSNALRMVVRLWMRGYGEGRTHDYFTGTMRENRLTDLTVDFREFGEAVGFLDPRNKDSALRTFKEANFFTFSGNGDSVLDSHETYELLHFMVSGGLVVTDMMFKKSVAAGCALSEPDLMGRPLLDLTCFKEVFAANFSVFFSALPGMTKYVDGLRGGPGFDRFFDSLVALSREQTANPGIIEYSEFRAVASLVQYMESLFVLYDVNQSQGLSVSELLKAELRFHAFIEKVSPVKTSALIPEIFLYLALEGKKPRAEWPLLGYAGRRLTGTLKEANRLQLLQVLGVLKNDAK